ncbi:MAG: NAD(P)/FAD-dependent oxidoreductase [Sphingomonas bacterium]
MITQKDAIAADFDLDALREKYRQERDKRIRPEGNAQYVEVRGEFSHYIDDPYYDPGFTREPRNDETEILVIGGGFGGLIAASRLRRAGFEDIRIIEKAGDFGGAWYWNRYPGIQCDTESYIYLPLLEETGYIPTEKYIRGSEIREYAERIARQFDLYRDVCFRTIVTDMRWLEDEGKWLVATNRGDRMKARFVLMSSGPLNRPKLPGIPGIERFRGHMFHTCRWDYAYTGGDSGGDLRGLADKRVAIIGTGATAIQCVPYVARDAKRLFVFQRTPSSVDARGNRPTDPEWVRSLRPGWQKTRMENFNALVSGVPQDQDLVNDGWTDIMRNLAGITLRHEAGETDPETLAALTELADFRKMNEIRARVDAIVSDERTAEALKPWYRQFCKRPTFNDDYLAAFNRPNVSLVDTLGRGVERISEAGPVADGVEYPVDCIIFATGFEIGTAYTRRAGLEVHGRGGRTLTDHWQGGVKTLHGFYSHGFPNCFHLGITQGTITTNFCHMLLEQADHVAAVLDRARTLGADIVEPTEAAEAEWVETIRRTKLRNLDFLEACTPGYYNNEGHPGEGNGPIDEQYGGGSIAFFDLIHQWRAEGSFRGLGFGAAGA